VPGFDRSLEAILLKALERSPRDRYAGAAELLADLRNPGAVQPYDPEKGAPAAASPCRDGCSCP